MARVYYSLYDRMLSIDNLRKGFQKVKSAKGAAGVDGQTIDDFAENLEDNLAHLAQELRDKSYRPLPVKRVEIPKPNGGVRLLGIPAVRDRVVQQALLDILQPIFDPEFHPSSSGYRPGKSAHQAIAKATLFIREYDMRWVVDMDLSKCFDTLDHEIIIQSIRKRVALWKKPKRLHRRLRQLGYKGEFKKIRMQSWHNSKSPLASYALPNKYFDELGLFDLGTVQTGIPVSWR